MKTTLAVADDKTIKVTPDMIEAGYIAYLKERERLEDSDYDDKGSALTRIFEAMVEEMMSQKAE